MKKKVVILGAGVSGLAAGYFLAKTSKFDVVVIEQAPDVGGLCASFSSNGFTLDYGAHKMYSTIPGVLDQLKVFMGDRILELPKKNRIYLKGHLIDYPLKLGSLLKALGPLTFLSLGFGYGISVLKGLIIRKKPSSYAEYMKSCFGTPTYNLVFEPLADKVWGNPDQLHAEMARTRVPASNGLEVILKLLGLKKETVDTNAEFFYYPKAGFGDFPQKLKEDMQKLSGQVLCKAQLKACHKKGNEIVSVDVEVNGRTENLPCDYLISTIPLGVLSRLIFADQPAGFKHYVDDLQFRHLILVYLVIKRPLVLNEQWIFFPERRFIFSRIFEQKQMNPDLGPSDKTVICCDFTCDENSQYWKSSDDQLAKQCIAGLVDGGFIKAEEVESSFVKRQKNFYPRYDTAYMEKISACSKQLQTVPNLLLTGRLGMYNYNNSDHCFDMASFISSHLEKNASATDTWKALEERVSTYRIVD